MCVFIYIVNLVIKICCIIFGVSLFSIHFKVGVAAGWLLLLFFLDPLVRWLVI